MSVFMVQAKVKEESLAEVEAAAAEMFGALAEEKPKGVRYYASLKVPDSNDFVALLELEEGVENPLPAIPAFQEFQEVLKDQYAGPPVFRNLDVVGAYRSP